MGHPCRSIETCLLRPPHNSLSLRIRIHHPSLEVHRRRWDRQCRLRMAGTCLPSRPWVVHPAQEAACLYPRCSVDPLHPANQALPRNILRRQARLQHLRRIRDRFSNHLEARRLESITQLFANHKRRISVRKIYKDIPVIIVQIPAAPPVHRRSPRPIIDM
jgi:hypothetical protein